MDENSPAPIRKLSTRQEQCLLLVGKGYSSKEIARKLGISPSTVDSHIGTATQLLGYDDRRKAARMLLLDESDNPVPSLELDKPTNEFVLFRFPPLGGHSNKLKPHARMLQIVHISLISVVVLGVIMIIISGIVELLHR